MPLIANGTMNGGTRLQVRGSSASFGRAGQASVRAFLRLLGLTCMFRRAAAMSSRLSPGVSLSEPSNDIQSIAMYGSGASVYRCRLVLQARPLCTLQSQIDILPYRRNIVGEECM